MVKIFSSTCVVGLKQTHPTVTLVSSQLTKCRDLKKLGDDLLFNFLNVTNFFLTFLIMTIFLLADFFLPKFYFNLTVSCLPYLNQLRFFYLDFNLLDKILLV